jgi:LysR family glycine cleavage system transcriptional activator
MNWNLPSLSSLRVLEAVARHKSFTNAGKELNITQSAISRQVAVLEDTLGVRLFERLRHQVVPTADGQTYLAKIAGPLRQIESATIELASRKTGAGVLTLATPPAFGMRWLIPRLPRFYEQHPQIILNLVTRASTAEFSMGDCDVVIHYGRGSLLGMTVVPLTGDRLVVVGAPSYLQQFKRLKTPGDLTNAIKLQPMTRPTLWRDWLADNNVPERNPWYGPRFEHNYLIVQAAVAGIGIALLPALLVIDEIKSGRLINPFESDFINPDCYRLVFAQSTATDRKLAMFRDWISKEARRCVAHE